jgi:topoisomerase-4 subunit B
MGSEPGMPSVRTFVNDFVKTKLDNIYKNPPTAEALLRKILQAERERKELSGIRKLATDRAKKANLHNKKLEIVVRIFRILKILGI